MVRVILVPLLLIQVHYLLAKLKTLVLERFIDLGFNNLVVPEKSLSTISSALQPLHIHFQSYKGKESIKQVCSTLGSM